MKNLLFGGCDRTQKGVLVLRFHKLLQDKPGNFFEVDRSVTFDLEFEAGIERRRVEAGDEVGACGLSRSCCLFWSWNRTWIRSRCEVEAEKVLVDSRMS